LKGALKSSKLPSKIGWKITLPFEQPLSFFHNPAPANIIIEEATKDEFETEDVPKEKHRPADFFYKSSSLVDSEYSGSAKNLIVVV
jgi:hypothetical protein